MEIPKDLSEPYLRRNNVPLDPKQLSVISMEILEAVEKIPKLTRAYRLEVEFDDTEKVAHFCLCIEAVPWYDIFLQPGIIGNNIQISRDYITSTRKSIRPEEDGLPFEIRNDRTFGICTNWKENISHSPMENGCGTLFFVFLFSEYCYVDKYRPSNSYAINLLADNHPIVYCRSPTITHDGCDSTCDFNLHNFLLINELCSTKYVLAMHQKPIRGLVLMPNPGPRHMNHDVNRTFIIKEDVWKDILKFHQELKNRGIAVNFGRWDAAIQDEYLQDCHAQIHLQFDQEPWNHFKSQIMDMRCRKRLDVRKYPAADHRRRSCQELEDQRLTQLEALWTNRLIEGVGDSLDEMQEILLLISNTIEEVKNKVEEISDVFFAYPEPVDIN